jgi:hypothetical protein
MNKWEVKPYQEIIKENIDIMISFKDVESKVTMAEEIIYSIIKMATGDDLLLAGDILRSTTISLLVNTD